MDDHIKALLFISIGVIVAFLPLLFVKREKTSPQFLLFLASILAGLSLVGSSILAMIGDCSFLDALLMKAEVCRHLPFANTRVIAVMNGIAFSLLASVPVAVSRDLFFRATRNRRHGQL